MKNFLFTLVLCVGFSATAAPVEISSGVGYIPGSGYGEIDFGTVYVHTRRLARLNLRNTGSVPLTYRDDFMWDMDFYAYHNCRNGLLPGESCRIELEYRPVFEGFSNGRFEMRFNETSYDLTLRGRAIRRN